MLITVHGRVEMDPMRIPQAASMATGRDDSFEQVLQHTVDAEAPARVDDRNPPAAPADEADTERPEAKHEAKADDPEPTAAEGTPPPRDPEVLCTTANPTEHAVPVTDDIRRGEPERQETAGKGADSPRTSSQPYEPLLAAVVQHTSATIVPPVLAAGEPGVAAVGSARTTEAPTRGTEAPWTRANAALRAPGVAASYRTNNAASAQLLEQARDSVFKQILLKLTGDGGEMRMRLEPPDLGELDLRLVVQGGNRLELTIAADRQDVAQLLQRHLDELKQTLQQAGLEITGASVQTRSEFAREQGRRDAARDDGAWSAPPEQPQPTTDPQRSYVHATGLDFWA